MKAIKKLIEDATKKDSLDNLSRKELEGLIEKIYAEANAKIEYAEHLDGHTYTNLEVEAIQDLTINCYTDLYNTETGGDHVSTLAELREWGVEFEEWWSSLSFEEQAGEKDYLTEIDNFGSKKLKAIRYPNLKEKLEEIVREAESWEWKTVEDKNILTKLNCIIDQLKKEE